MRVDPKRRRLKNRLQNFHQTRPPERRVFAANSHQLPNSSRICSRPARCAAGEIRPRRGLGTLNSAYTEANSCWAPYFQVPCRVGWPKRKANWRAVASACREVQCACRAQSVVLEMGCKLIRPSYEIHDLAKAGIETGLSYDLGRLSSCLGNSCLHVELVVSHSDRPRWDMM